MSSQGIYLIIFPFVLLFVSFYLIKNQLFSVLFNKPTAPYVRTPKKDREIIVKEISKILKAGDIVYDFGAGDGSLLFALYKKSPNSFFVGIEYSFFPWILSLILNIKKLGNNFKLLKGDLFKKNIREADYIISFLMPKMMNLVYQKIKNESVKKVTLISIGFPVSGVKPDRVFKIEKKSGSFVLKTDLYFYNFN